MLVKKRDKERNVGKFNIWGGGGEEESLWEGWRVIGEE